MTKSKFLTIAVILLLIINMALIAFMVLKPHGHHRSSSPKEVIIETLHLTDDQIASYEHLISLHRKSLAELDVQLIETKKQLFSLLKEDDSEVKETQLLAEISALQSEIEHTHMEHFRDIKAICNADQKDKFNTLTEQIQQLFKHGPKKPKKH